VLESDPAAGSSLPCGSPVDLVVATSATVVDCVVPDVVGMTRDRATAAIEDADLTVGGVTEESSASAEPGTVIRTAPAVGAEVSCDSGIALVIDVEQPCTVPQVVGLTASAAVSALTEADLVKGAVTEEPDPSAEPDTVLSSTPRMGSEVDCGSRVDLVVAVAPPCTVPQVVGLTEQEARTAISDARLAVGDVGTEASSSAAEGEVLRSDPAAGATPECGSTVTIVVSSGPPPCTVPDVEGAQRDAAVAAIEDAGLTAAERSESSSEDAGTVLDLQPAAGSTVECGSTVTIIVSSGPETCTVPDVVGEAPDEADRLIENAGLTVRNGGTEASSTVTKGNIARSDPAAGEQRECDSTVTIFVSSGPNSVG
jgi:beta-lactam-binding protein with PASTA domain